jgi:hypothetical protein
MSIWTTIKEWCNKPAVPQAVKWIRQEDVKPPYGVTPAKGDECYLRIWLVEMVLSQSRSWFKDQQPTAQALTKLKFGDHLVEIPSIAAANSARYAQGKSVLQNYRLLDLVPFRGGSVEIEAALIALQGDDKLANGIRALSNVAGLFAAPIASALGAANKVKESADMLVGTGPQIELAYHNTFTAEAGDNQLRSGYLAVIQAKPSDLGNLMPVVDNGELRLWDGTSAHVVGYDYMLLRFEIVSNRDDLRAFSDLEKLRAAALQAFVQQGNEAGDKAYRAALGAILTHPELINADRRVLAAELKADCDPLRGGNLGMVAGPPPRTWDEVIKELPAGKDHAAVTMAEFT